MSLVNRLNRAAGKRNTFKNGASIEMLAMGTADAATKTGRYWAKRLGQGAAVESLTLSPMNKGAHWKVIIKYQAKETERS